MFVANEAKFRIGGSTKLTFQSTNISATSISMASSGLSDQCKGEIKVIVPNAAGTEVTMYIPLYTSATSS